MTSIDPDIVDYSAGILLRYFRGGGRIDGDIPRLDRRRDLSVLRGHWAVSEPVRTLVTHLLARPHEAQALFTFRERVDDAIARGRIDARKTQIYRMQTGLPSALVSHEPVRTFNTGPNMLLAWVLSEAAAYTGRLLSWQGATSPYLPIIEESQQQMRLVHRLEALRDPLRAVALGQRPTAGVLRVAARSRRPLYRLAVDAYRLLQGIERGEDAAIERVARSALIAPLEDWRRFELAVALSVGEAIARALAVPVQLHILGADSSGPIVTAGNFAVYWQQITMHHTPPALEPSEVAAREVLKDYGIAVGTERPDLVIVDRDAGRVASVVEVKFIAGDTATGRFREAVDQVVRYGRSYAAPGDRAALLTRSLVAISRNAPARLHHNAPAPFAIDFERLRQPHGLDAWAAAVTAQP